MTENSVALIALLLFLVLILVKPLGLYRAQVMEGGPATGRPIWALRIGVPVERLIYRLSGIDSSAEMGWKRYMIALLLFNSLGVLVLYALQRVQLWLPLNPQQFANVTPDSSFNTAVSFATNTNWQGYSGESTMSYLTQMLGLAVQNFLSAAAGIVVVIALIRGFIRHTVRPPGPRSLGCCSRPRPLAGYTGRAPRQCAGAQPGVGCDEADGCRESARCREDAPNGRLT